MRLASGAMGLKSGASPRTDPRNPMSATPASHDTASDDPVEKIVPLMPLVLPVAGGVLIFLLAFIAVFMA